MCVIILVGLMVNLAAGLLGVSMTESPVVLLISSTTGMAQTVMFVLALAPPRAYLAWVRDASTAPDPKPAASWPGRSDLEPTLRVHAHEIEDE
jgi:hypothetical protein